uniref:Uncharacterized protein n=1 Tax=Cacopsylla melanoneura TaxID=428564 RepID=A0A8D8VWN4_9HEMI
MRVWKNDLCHIIKLYRRSGFESRQMHKEYSLLLLTKTKQSASVGQGDLFVDPWLTSYEMRMISTLRNTICTVKNSILSINSFRNNEQRYFYGIPPMGVTIYISMHLYSF